MNDQPIKVINQVMLDPNSPIYNDLLYGGGGGFGGMPPNTNSRYKGRILSMQGGNGTSLSPSPADSRRCIVALWSSKHQQMFCMELTEKDLLEGAGNGEENIPSADSAGAQVRTI